MALPSSGPISINAINVELGKAGTTQSSLGQTDFRTLAGVASGAISLASFYGKANWVYQAGRTIVGDTGLVQDFTAITSFEWTPPANNRIVTLYCEAYVYQHTGGSAQGGEYAYVYARIEGWNGSSWVQLAQSGENGTDSQGATAYVGVGYSFNPYNSTYSKFRFTSLGNGFKRGVAGYKDAWYYQ